MVFKIAIDAEWMVVRKQPQRRGGKYRRMEINSK